MLCFYSDPGSGKTSVIRGCSSSGDTTFLTKVNGKVETLTLIDTEAGGEMSSKHLRTNQYGDADVILLCFSLDSPSLFHNLSAKWQKELKFFASSVPVILLGTKTDLRAAGGPMITHVEGEAKAAELNAFAYLECSTLTKEGLKQITDSIVSCAVKTVKKPRKHCIIS